MPALLIASPPGRTFGLLLMRVRDWCDQHQIEPVKLTYKLSMSGNGPELCVEFHSDAQANDFALTFPGGVRRSACPDLDFSVEKRAGS